MPQSSIGLSTVTIAASWPDNGDAMSRLRVYLDQNKWIDLARAATGHPDGARFTDVLEIARHGAKAGLVIFPRRNRPDCHGVADQLRGAQRRQALRHLSRTVAHLYMRLFLRPNR